MRTPVVALALGLASAALAARAPAQAPSPAASGPSLRHGAVRYGKWLTAGAAVAFTVMAAHEHSYSQRNWDELLTACRSADDACARGSDGRYISAYAEGLYQQSMYYDARANRRLLGAQASLLVTAALFIIDLSGRNDEPDNIPFSPLRVSVDPRGGGALVGMRIAF